MDRNKNIKEIIQLLKLIKNREEEHNKTWIEVTQIQSKLIKSLRNENQFLSIYFRKYIMDERMKKDINEKDINEQD